MRSTLFGEPPTTSCRRSLTENSQGERSAASSGKSDAYGTGTLRVATLVNRLEQEKDLQGVYYAPRIYARLLSVGKLESQGCDIRLCEGGMGACLSTLMG
jgi:hypothetical protein